jgi:hypothetical protein
MSDPSAQSADAVVARPMFKKVVKKSKIKARLRARSEDDESSSQSAMNAIQETRKKRKLLNEFQYKRGLDATLAVTTPSSQPTTAFSSEPKTQADLNERLKVTFSGGTGGDANSGEGGVLQHKHKDAMEEFIRQNLKQSQEEEPEMQEGSSSTIKDMKAKLYAELASASLQLAGSKETQKAEEGDVGAGGAMLGGTGIAEVALPVDDRIQTIKETEQAVSLVRPQRRVLNRDTLLQREAVASLPLSFSAGVGKRGKSNLPMIPMQAAAAKEALENGGVSSSAGYGDDVSNVPSSYSHNFQLHTQEWVQQKRDGQQQANEPVAVDKYIDVAANHERIGFEAARRSARGKDDAAEKESKDASQKAEKRSTDDRVWKSFMAKQHDNRERYG